MVLEVMAASVILTTSSNNYRLVLNMELAIYSGSHDGVMARCSPAGLKFLGLSPYQVRFFSEVQLTLTWMSDNVLVSRAACMIFTTSHTESQLSIIT